MINLMIVDDEEIVRKGIAMSIDWNQYGIAVTGQASNGKIALEIARNVNPDIVITDIKMPVMDGLELSKHLRELFPSVKLIILTGYKEFEYAKKAIEFKVSEFVLKPIGAEKLLNSVIKLKNEVMERKERENNEKANGLFFQKNLSTIKERVILELASRAQNNHDKSEFDYIFDELNINFSGPFYQAFIIGIDDYFFTVGNRAPEKRQMIFDSIDRIVQEYPLQNSNCYLCRNEANQFIGIANISNRYINIVKMCMDIQLLIKIQLNLCVSIGIGNTTNDLFDIYKSCREASFALKNRIYTGKSSIIHINQSEKKFSKAIALGNSLVEEQDLINSMKVLDQNEIARLLESIFMRLKLVKADYSSLKNVSLRLILAAYRGAEEMGIDIAEQSEMQEDIFQKVEKYETAEDLQNWVNGVVSGLVMIIKKANNYNSVVRAAMDYMIKNYNKSFCLKDIAQKVHVTPNYLCRIFKEETGQSCMEWLNKYRIEKAKNLLKNDINMKIYEVAEYVGFRDYKNFSYNFKKYAKCSASKYYAGVENIRRKSC